MVEYLWHAFPDGRDIRAASWFIQVFDDEHKEMANEMCADGASFEEAVVSYTHPDSLWPGTPFFVVRPNTPENIDDLPPYQISANFESGPVKDQRCLSSLTIVWFQDDLDRFLDQRSARQFDKQIDWESLAVEYIEEH